MRAFPNPFVERWTPSHARLVRGESQKIAFSRRRRGSGSCTASVSKCGHGVADRFTNRDREHQRWLAHGFAAEDDVGIGGAFEKLYVENFGDLRPRRQLICGCASGGETALRVSIKPF